MGQRELELVCVECGRASAAEAVAWKAEIAYDTTGSDQPEVAIYCPDCWASEFG